jgi:hypothetical protein
LSRSKISSAVLVQANGRWLSFQVVTQARMLLERVQGFVRAAAWLFVG